MVIKWCNRFPYLSTVHKSSLKHSITKKNNLTAVPIKSANLEFGLIICSVFYFYWNIYSAFFFKEVSVDVNLLEDVFSLKL